jgi:hypothetical protein
LGPFASEFGSTAVNPLADLSEMFTSLAGVASLGMF